jgi:hypothetical protein
VADRGTGTFIPSAPFRVGTDYDPITRGGGGGEPVEVKRLILRDGEWVPIQ